MLQNILNQTTGADINLISIGHLCTVLFALISQAASILLLLYISLCSYVSLVCKEHKISQKPTHPTPNHLVQIFSACSLGQSVDSKGM
jgi:hypothetical protein